jgi:YbbR domain-containing protein
VPVLLAKNLQLKNQYHISGPIKLKPEYVTIAGPATVLAGIHFWKTDSLKMKNVSNNISKTVSLQPTKANISIYPHNVNVIIPVDEFTEKSIEVPVKILNNRHYEVKLLPEKVKITFLVALNNYPETNIESFKAAVDLNNWVNQKYTQLPVQLIKLPKYCKLVSVEPQTIDFILQE